MFTPNEHYLDQIFRDLIAQDTGDWIDGEGSATLLYYRVRAYLKVQQKLVVEAAGKTLSLYFEEKFAKAFMQLLHSGEHEETLVQLGEEPLGMKDERDMLKRRKIALKQAIEQLQSAD